MHDVIIVGAGPAGAACALSLSRGGYRVALLDGATFPRDKICGDAIPGAACRSLARLADELGLPRPPAAVTEDIRHARFYADRPRPLRLTWSVPAYNATREAFDDWLYRTVRERTDTDVHEGVRVRGVRRERDRLVVEADGGEWAGRFVVGCDGAHSAVARSLTDTRLDRRHHFAAVRAYFQDVSGARAATNDVYYLRRWQPGYLWVFPLPGNLYNVGFGMASDEVSRRRINLRTAMAEALDEHPGLRERFASAQQIGPTAGFGLPVGSRSVRAHGDRFVLCGDAAALIDPIGGHGIDKAIDSGVYAAECALACLREGRFDADATARYERALARHVRPTLRRNGRIMRLGTRFPWLATALVELERVPWLKAIAQQAM